MNFHTTFFFGDPDERVYVVQEIVPPVTEPGSAPIKAPIPAPPGPPIAAPITAPMMAPMTPALVPLAQEIYLLPELDYFQVFDPALIRLEASDCSILSTVAIVSPFCVIIPRFSSYLMVSLFPLFCH